MLCFAVPGKMARVVILPANYWTMVRRLIMLLTGLQEKSFREAIKLFLWNSSPSWEGLATSEAL